MKISQLTTVVKANQTKLFGLGEDGNVYRWNWKSGTWVLYKETNEAK